MTTTTLATWLASVADGGPSWATTEADGDHVRDIIAELPADDTTADFWQADDTTIGTARLSASGVWVVWQVSPWFAAVRACGTVEEAEATRAELWDAVADASRENAVAALEAAGHTEADAVALVRSWGDAGISWAEGRPDVITADDVAMLLDTYPAGGAA